MEEIFFNDWKKVAKVAEESLKNWEHSFEMEYGGDAHLLKHGQRTLGKLRLEAGIMKA